jgi:membrane protein DedA with SNARE-associated domain
MSFESIILQFGYTALVIGSLLEGETLLVMGAFMAHRGYLNLWAVIFIGFMMAFISDQFFYWMGRTRGMQFLENRPSWKPKIEKAKSLLGKNPYLLFFSFRFMYGLRAVIAFVIGLGKFEPKHFIPLNLLGSLVWAFTFGFLGFAFGKLAEIILEDIEKYEGWLLFIMVLIGIIAWMYSHIRNKSL